MPSILIADIAQKNKKKISPMMRM